MDSQAETKGEREELKGKKKTCSTFRLMISIVHFFILTLFTGNFSFGQLRFIEQIKKLLNQLNTPDEVTSENMGELH